MEQKKLPVAVVGFSSTTKGRRVIVGPFLKRFRDLADVNNHLIGADEKEKGF
jgi:hypothetical protein